MDLFSLSVSSQLYIGSVCVSSIRSTVPSRPKSRFSPIGSQCYSPSFAFLRRPIALQIRPPAFLLGPTHPQQTYPPPPTPSPPHSQHAQTSPHTQHAPRHTPLPYSRSFFMGPPKMLGPRKSDKLAYIFAYGNFFSYIYRLMPQPRLSLSPPRGCSCVPCVP